MSGKTFGSGEESLANKITTIIHEHFAPDMQIIPHDASLKDDLGLDDLDYIELTMALEEKFQLIIPDTDSERWRTLGDVIYYITWKMGGERQGDAYE